MTSLHVSINELRVGLAVQYLGEEPDRIGLLSPELVRRGVALFPVIPDASGTPRSSTYGSPGSG